MDINSTAGLRTFLLEQMTKLAEGKVEPGQAKAVCALAQQVYNTVKLEIQFAAIKTKGNAGGITAVDFSQQRRMR